MTARPATVLITSDRDWSSRSLESILGPHGYTVLKTLDAAQTLARVEESRPDAIILDAESAGPIELEICRAITASPAARSTPILIAVAGPVTRQFALEALRAGAWDVLGGLPLDAEELLLRLQVYTQAKLDADQAREEGLLDHETGLYNLRGLLRRATEMSAEAARRDMPLACLAISSHAPDEPVPDDAPPPLDRLVEWLRTAGRASDVIGRLGPTELIILAPHTDRDGASRLARRICAMGDPEERAADAHRAALRPCVGYCAVPSFRDSSLDPVDLLVRATMALRRAQADARRQRIHDASEPAAPAPAPGAG